MTLTGEERGIRRNPCPSATRFRPTIFIIITVPVITFMHGNYSFIPETNHVSTVYSVAAVLYLQSVLHVMSFRPWIIIIIIIIIINIMNYYHHHHHHPCYHLYARYLQLYTWNKPRFYSIQCCSCSVCTVCATCNVISSVQYVPYFSFSTSRSLCAARNVAVLCSSLISPFPGTLLRYRLRDFETVPVATIITGITFGVAFQLRWTSIVRSLYFKIFAYFLLLLLLLLLSLWNHTTTDYKEGEQLEDRRSVDASSCNCGDGTDQRDQSLMMMFMMMITISISINVLSSIRMLASSIHSRYKYSLSRRLVPCSLPLSVFCTHAALTRGLFVSLLQTVTIKSYFKYSIIV